MTRRPTLGSSRFYFLILVTVLAASCKGDSPTGPSVPSVAGVYRGAVVVTWPTSITCQATALMSQSGDRVTIGSIEVHGPCGFSVPFGDATISATGSLAVSEVTVALPCGATGSETYTGTPTGEFSGKEFRVSIFYANVTEGRRCSDLSVTGTLVRP